MALRGAQAICSLRIGTIAEWVYKQYDFLTTVYQGRELIPAN